MENSTSFGTFNVPTLESSLTATFTVPGILSVETMKKIFTSIEESKHVDTEQDLEISHGSYFGENIRQAIKAFK